MIAQVTTLAPESACITLAGRLDFVALAPVANAIDEALAAGRTRIVVDLHEVTVADSSGVTALVAGLKSARLAGGDLRLARAGAPVKGVLALLHLDTVLACHETIEGATRAFPRDRGS